jgi:hypothetical protein
MDLEEFEVKRRGPDIATNDVTGSLSIPKALERIDAEWHTASRRARWMDLLGDYAGTEPFIIDGSTIASSHACFANLRDFSIGHSLIQLVVDDPLLALGKPGGKHWHCITS